VDVDIMTRDDIIRMAREAGAMFEHMSWVERDLFPVFARFAALVAAAAVRETSAEYRLGWNDGAMMEREACAKLCEEYDDGRHANRADLCADAIRARGQE
jgi:hypothetical protein